MTTLTDKRLDELKSQYKLTKKQIFILSLIYIGMSQTVKCGEFKLNRKDVLKLNEKGLINIVNSTPIHRKTKENQYEITLKIGA